MAKPIREILDDHIANILAQLEPAAAQVAFLERELADARRARAAIEAQTPSALVTQNMVRVLRAHQIRRAQNYGGGEAVITRASPYSGLTMKQLVRRALDEHFGNGATANELLDFFRDAWGRDDIVRTSLSPQLSRLKREGVIFLRGMKWHLVGPDQDADRNENGAPATLPLDAPETERARNPFLPSTPTTNGLER